MNEAIPWIISAFLSVAVIYLAISWAFECKEKNELKEREYSIFTQNLGINERLADDVAFLESELRPYKDLANLYRCNNAKELHFLIRDLETKLYYKNHNMMEKK